MVFVTADVNVQYNSIACKTTGVFKHRPVSGGSEEGERGINLLGFFMFIVYPVITETGLFSGAASFAFLRQFEGNSRQKVDGNCAEDTASLQPAAAPAGPIRIMTRSASNNTRHQGTERKAENSPKSGTKNLPRIFYIALHFIS